MNIFAWLSLLGGIGLFLYGMSMVGSALEKLAGASLEKILEKLTTSKNQFLGSLKGLGLGTGVTGLIQSSAATTIMVVGFVNAGIMTIIQALPVVMGANIGSTVTAYIVSLGDIDGGANLILSLLKPSAFSPIMIVIGAFILLLSKKKKPRNIAEVMLGFGILFLGMETMSSALSPLRSSPTFQGLFTKFQNPLLGVLVGILVTCLIQSSSASVGILQVLARSSGKISWSIAMPIIIGENIGKCLTVLLASFGTNKKAKRVVAGHLLFNFFGATVFLIVIYGIQYTIGWKYWNQNVSSLDIANFHFFFNFATSMILIPLNKRFAALTGKLLKDDEESKLDTALATLDDFLLNTPTIAIEQCRKVMLLMGDAIVENYKLAIDLIYHYDDKKRYELETNEKFIDRAESSLNEYLLKINQKSLHSEERRRAAEILNSISDFERMGDHCVSIADVAYNKVEQNIHFSKNGRTELSYITSAVENIIYTTLHVFSEDDLDTAYKIEPLSDAINILKEAIKGHHVYRLQTGDCGIQGGVALVELLTSLERISGHCANIALHVIKKVGNNESFDENGHVKDQCRYNSEDYRSLYNYYYDQYVEPITELGQAPIMEPLDNDEAAISSEISQIKKQKIKKTKDKQKKPKDHKNIKESSKNEKDKNENKGNKK